MAQVHPLGVGAEGLPGSAAMQGFATSGFKHPAPIPSPQGIKASGAHCGAISSSQANLPLVSGGSDFMPLQSTSDIPFLGCRTSAPEHNASVNCMPTNLTMISLSQEISQVLSEALNQTTE